METTDNATSVQLMSGTLFIAPDGVSNDEVVSDKYRAGATAGKVEIRVRENVHTVRDMDGNKVCDIHFGARLEVKGRLASITPEATALLLGARRAAPGRYEVSEAPAVRRLTLCLVCPIYGSEEDFTLLLHTASDEGASLTLDPTGEDSLSFCVVSENRYGKTSASLTFGERRAS